MATKVKSKHKYKPIKSIAKRVRFSKGGKVIYQKSGKRKLMSHKSGDHRRRLRARAVMVNETIAEKFREWAGVK